MTKIKNLHGLILAGGFSKRMGQDKALISYHGKPQIEYVRDLLEVRCEQVSLSKRVEQPSYPNINSINDHDAFKDRGPLGGILSAMKAYPEASWLVMACDLPFVTQDTLDELITKRNPQKIATAFKSTQDSLPEPLCAIWEGHGSGVVLDFFARGIHCPRKVLINSDVQLLEQTNPQWLDNVNNERELQETLKKLC